MAKESLIPCVCLVPLHHGGAKYAAGSTVQLSKELVELLSEDGKVQLPGQKTTSKSTEKEAK